MRTGRLSHTDEQRVSERKGQTKRQRRKAKRQKAKENGKGERQMKATNVKWGRGKREATGNKSKCKRRVCETYLDRS